MKTKTMHLLAAAVILMPASVLAQKVIVEKEVAAGLPRVASLQALTKWPKHHFFGYYGINPWDPTGKDIACMETDFGDRPVRDDDLASIVLVNVESGEKRILADTRAWNFQQGSLLHWLPDGPARRVIYNDRVHGVPKAVILDVDSGERRVLPRPIAALAPGGKIAASINYARLATTRPGYGYAGVPDPYADDPHPKEDGLYVMDVASGDTTLVASMDQVFHLQAVPEALVEKTMWFNHVLFSRDAKRIFFMARYHGAAGPLITAGFTVGTDGSDLRCILPYEWGASHFDWVDGKNMVITTKYQAGDKWLHVLIPDGAPLEEYTPLAPDFFQIDGHCHVSYDGKWMVSDSYPRGSGRMRELYIMNMDTQSAARIAAFHEPPAFAGEYRCDLHPRWSPDGKTICIDSTNEGTRQVVLVHLDYAAP